MRLYTVTTHKVWTEPDETSNEIMVNENGRMVTYRPFDISDCMQCTCRNRNGRIVKVYAKTKCEGRETYAETVAKLTPLFIAEAKRLDVPTETLNWRKINYRLQQEKEDN